MESRDVLLMALASSDSHQPLGLASALGLASRAFGREEEGALGMGQGQGLSCGLLSSLML